MKIKTLLQAPLILEELKRLNIDPTTLDPNTRVKLIDGGLHFEGEKECFVSAKNEESEYYYLKEGDVVIKGDYFMNSKEEWIECLGLIGKIVTKQEEGIYRRKIQKKTTL